LTEMAKTERKQAVSLRLSGNDLRKLKVVSERLGVSDSDVLRYALTTTLNRIGPLCDPGTRGADLIPALVASGPDFIRHFDLDAARLEQVINTGAPSDRRVAREDLVALCFAASNPEFSWSKVGRPMSLEVGGDALRSVTGSPKAIQSLRHHLFEKYSPTAPFPQEYPSPSGSSTTDEA
jgi:hypothetical protein